MDRPMEMVVSGPVGYPISTEGSGYRNVRVTPDAIDHTWSKLTFKPPFMDAVTD
jgi:hypothetical protein